MKALSQITTYVFLFAFATFILFAVVMTSNSMEKSYSSFSVNSSISSICSLISYSINRVSSIVPGEVSIDEEETFGELTIKLPERIGDENYRIVFRNNTVLIYTGNINVSCGVFSDVNLDGNAIGGPVKIEFTVNGKNRIARITSV